MNFMFLIKTKPGSWLAMGNFRILKITHCGKQRNLIQ